MRVSSGRPHWVPFLGSGGRPAPGRRSGRFSRWRAVILASAYCAGLGLPFLLLATAWDRAGRFNDFLRRHQRFIHRAGGVLLLLVGLLLVTGLWDTLTLWLRVHVVNGFEVIV